MGVPGRGEGLSRLSGACGRQERRREASQIPDGIPYSSQMRRISPCRLHSCFLPASLPRPGPLLQGGTAMTWEGKSPCRFSTAVQTLSVARLKASLLCQSVVAKMAAITRSITQEHASTASQMWLEHRNAERRAAQALWSR